MAKPSSDVFEQWVFETADLGMLAIAKRICGEAHRHDPTGLS